MSKSQFVDNKLVNIRDRLAVADNTVVPDNNSELEERVSKAKNSSSMRDASKKSDKRTSTINDRDWKKSLFNRWDDFSKTKVDLLNRVTERISLTPLEVADLEKNILQLNNDSIKYQNILDRLNDLDDSSWNRENFTSELSSSMRSLENLRIEYMMLIKNSTRREPGVVVDNFNSNSNVIHELNSLTFGNLFKIGFAFFMPLIMGLIFSVIMWGLIYYLSIH